MSEVLRGTLRGSIYVVNMSSEAPAPSSRDSLGCAHRILPKEEPKEDEVDEGKSPDKPESSDEVEPEGNKEVRRKRARGKRTKKPQTDEEKERLSKLAMEMHIRFGHKSASDLRKICKDQSIEGISHQFLSAVLKKCPHCTAGKMKRKVKGKPQEEPKEVGEYVDADSSPGHPSLPDKRTGFQLTVERKSKWRWVNIYKNKTENPKVLLSIFRRMKNQGRPVKKLRTDNAGEYKSKEFRGQLEDLGIEQEFSAPRCQYQNPAERQIGLVHDTAATFLSQSGLKPEKHWADAIKQAVYVLNRLPTQALDWKSPFEIMMGKKPKESDFHPFGCLCFKHDVTNKSQFHPKGSACVFLGSSDQHDGFIVMRLRDGRRTTEKNVTFFDNTFPYFKDFVPQDIEKSDDHVVVTFPSLPVAPALNVEREIPNSGGNADSESAEKSKPTQKVRFSEPNENSVSPDEKVEENLPTSTSPSTSSTPTTPTPPPSKDSSSEEDDTEPPSKDESSDEDDPTDVDTSGDEDESADKTEADSEPEPGAFIKTGHPDYHRAKFFDDFDKLGNWKDRHRKAATKQSDEYEYPDPKPSRNREKVTSVIMEEVNSILVDFVETHNDINCLFSLDNVTEPKSIRQAFRDPKYSAQWKAAAEKEINDLKRNKTWKLISRSELPPGTKVH